MTDDAKGLDGSDYPRDLTDLLSEVAYHGGSDLHITAGRRPTMRRNGVLVELDAPVMHARDTRALINAILTDEHRDTLERQWAVDYAHSIPGAARYRINVYFQRGSLGAACRYLPASIGDFASLGLPAIMAEFAMKPRGLVLVTGPTGSGKTTTLASVVDYINKNRGRISSQSRTRSSTSTRTGVPSSHSARWARTQRASPTRSAMCCAKTRMSW